jgi:two-component system uhpT operon response regulator UhpA
MSVTVAIVDDHEAIRLGFAGACQQRGLDIVGSAPTVEELISSVEVIPQIVVLDLSLADGSEPADNVKSLMAKGSEVIIFSIADRKSQVRAALSAGAATLITKSQQMDELFAAISLVAVGAYVNTTETVAAIDSDQEFKVKLTERELEVVRLYASGMSLKQVAFELKVSNSTVKEHIDRVRVKYSDVGRPVRGKSELLIRLIEDDEYPGELL